MVVARTPRRVRLPAHAGALPTATAAIATACVLALSTGVFAQARLAPPPASPRAAATQTIGVSDVTITWNRPGVKGRTIWGELVPWDEMWRAGANENTTISFQHPVQIEGQRLAAGTYGLHMLPTQKDWTVVFSRNSTSWGSYSYTAEEDALRVTVKPVSAPMTEWLTYEFTELAPDAATLTLRWEKLAVPLHLHVDTPAIFLESVRNDFLPSLSPSAWQGWNSAAAYCLQNKVNLEEALEWSDESVAIAENFTNLTTRAGLLEALGRTAEAQALQEKAVSMATEQELNVLGYQYLNAKELQRAIDTFKLLVAQHPDSWNAHDSLAEAYQAAGDKAPAIEHFKQALALAKNDEQRQRINGSLKQLGAR